MSHTHIDTEQGHWLLAKMGKKVLRPGGKELSLKLVEALKVTPQDAVVEFAPGMGFTATITLKKNPRSYTGIEINEEAAAKLKNEITGTNRTIINTTAADTGLDEAAYDKVYGEAMLTMQADHRKSEIIGEAFRILKKGGLYGIHELGLKPDDLDPKVKGSIQRKLAQVIKINARPLTKKEWCSLLEKEGFTVKAVFESPMHLLKPKRILSDEGFFRTLKIVFNILTHPAARKRIIKMREIFKTYEDQITAFAIIAEK